MSVFPKRLMLATILSILLLGSGATALAFYQHWQILDRYDEDFSRHHKSHIASMGRELVLKEVGFIRRQMAAQPSDTLQKTTLERLRHLRFGHNQNGYFFVLQLHDITGGEAFAKELLLPIDTTMEGVFLDSRITDTTGKRYREIYLADLRQSGEAIIEYWYHKPDEGIPRPKISYLYHLKEWDWVIGAGFYLDDLDALLLQERQISRRFMIEHTFIIALAILGFSAVVALFYLSAYRKLKERFTHYEKQIKLQNEELLTKERHLNENAKIVATGEMLKMVAHHWRQPLNAVSILIQDLAEAKRADELSDEYLSETIKKSMRVIAQMSKTIDNFRGFLSEERSGVFDVAMIVSQATDLMAPQMRESGITVTLSTQETPMLVRGPSALFGRTLISLLNNAKDAIESHRSSGGHIILNLERENHRALLSISDNGPGLLAEAKEKLFLPYFTTKEPGKGNGLGLYSAKSVIEGQLKGTISLESSPDGVVIKISLPLL